MNLNACANYLPEKKTVLKIRERLNNSANTNCNITIQCDNTTVINQYCQTQVSDDLPYSNIIVASVAWSCMEQTVGPMEI